jgi:osmotically-inducible protein OsmY
MRPSTQNAAPADAAPKHGAIGHLSADEELQQAVCQALIEDGELDTSQIGVRVVHETVVLSGRVKDHGALERAVNIAKALHGVANVHADELRCSDA